MMKEKTFFFEDRYQLNINQQTADQAEMRSRLNSMSLLGGGFVLRRMLNISANFNFHQLQIATSSPIHLTNPIRSLHMSGVCDLIVVVRIGFLKRLY